jgi:tripeptide aminopeptidase
LAQLDHMRECCLEAARKFDGRVEFRHEIAYPSLNVAPDSPLLQQALRACARLDIPSAAKGTGGGSDANIFAGHGLSCINLGIGMSKVHTTDEFITVNSFGAIRSFGGGIDAKLSPPRRPGDPRS